MARMSYGRAFAFHAEGDPDGIAIVFGEGSCTRGELERRSNRLARAYQKMGVSEGDLVTIALPNGIEFFEVCLAAWKLGATPSPVSSRLPDHERRAIVELASPALLAGAESGTYGGLATVAEGFEPDPALSDEPLPDVVARRVRAMTSGGSTGRPKLILETLPAQCDPEQAANGMRAGGTLLVPGPLYHAGPFITAWQQLLLGGRIVLLAHFDPALCLELIERHRVDWVLFVPTMMQRIWRLPEQERSARDLSSLDTVMCTGAPSPPWLKRAWIGWLGPEKILEAYGGSERIAGTQIDGTEWLAHPGSVGKPTGGRKIRILRPDGSECAPGELGEVYMMPAEGQGSTYEYVGATATATPDGWETLGDMGHLDEDGYLYLADRKADMIVTGGANVFPAEVEAALDAHPAVRSSAVVGLPDDDLGQRIHAIVDAPGGVDDAALRAHLAEHLVRYKIPRSFEYVSEPLRDDAGKVRRSALREARLSASVPGAGSAE
ncbi:MAG: AMP-binding protein [Proteobacteria bacterium]|nr:AMP-binding protein [Pseudomonadota bacterium]